MMDADLARAVSDALIVVLERGTAVTDRFVLATAELGQRVQEFLDADRAILARHGGAAEQMAASRRLSAARRALEASISAFRDVAMQPGWSESLPSVALPSAPVRRGRLARVWRWLWHGDPW